MSKKPKPIKRVRERRTRGTASILCPTCHKPSRVLRTARAEGGVNRERVCAKRHRFHTREVAQ